MSRANKALRAERPSVRFEKNFQLSFSLSLVVCIVLKQIWFSVSCISASASLSFFFPLYFCSFLRMLRCFNVCYIVCPLLQTLFPSLHKTALFLSPAFSFGFFVSHLSCLSLFFNFLPFEFLLPSSVFVCLCPTHHIRNRIRFQ